MENQPGSVKTILTVVVSLIAVLAAAWVFPLVWYEKSTGDFFWLSENSEMPGWRFEKVPISKEVAGMLNVDQTVDQIVTGKDNVQVRAFYIKNYAAKTGADSVFKHNPDVCWAGAGWKLISTQPEFVSVKIAGKDIGFERRCFSFQGQMQLVYFGALVGGDAVPYRMNYFKAMSDSGAGSQAGQHLARVTDLRFWDTILNSFRSRKSLQGPSHFIRVSTSVTPDDMGRGDQVLSSFLMDWMRQGSFKDEFEAANSKAEIEKAESRNK